MLPPSDPNSRPAAQLDARGFATRAVHAGERPPRPDFTPTTTPIYPATAYIYDETATQDAVFGNERPGYVYSRYGNPTNRALEQAVAALEGTENAIVFASGYVTIPQMCKAGLWLNFISMLVITAIAFLIVGTLIRA